MKKKKMVRIYEVDEYTLQRLSEDAQEHRGVHIPIKEIREDFEDYPYYLVDANDHKWIDFFKWREFEE